MPRKRNSKISRAIAAAIHEQVRIEKRKTKRELIYGKPKSEAIVDQRVSVSKNNQQPQTESNAIENEDFLQISVEPTDVDFLRSPNECDNQKVLIPRS